MYDFAGCLCHLAEISEHIYFLNLSEVDSRYHSRMAAVITGLRPFHPWEAFGRIAAAIPGCRTAKQL